jgi:hypothetical protein
MKAELKHPDLTTTSIVAKLLARENITVLKGNYQTASFDTRNRVLYLPLLNNKISKDCADMFVGHEVGHALYTPVETVEQFKTAHPDIPFSFLNIVEDVRIERMIQETYPGLLTSFNRAYAELIQMDIFNIQGRDLNELQFVDRLNLHAKIGTLLSIPLSDSERAFYRKCYEAKTIDEVVALTVELFKLHTEAKKDEDEISVNSKSDDKPDELEQMGGESVKEPSEEKSDEIGEGESDDSVDSTEDGESKPGSGTSAGRGDSLRSETDDAISKFFQKNLETKEFSIVSAPPRDVALTTVIPYQKLKGYREEYQKSQNDISAYDSKISELLIDLEREATVLVSEFNMRAAASNYQRTAQARTGNIDTNALHRYKIAEDIFKVLTIEPNQQNHGMVFFVDYSGSMTTNNAIVSVLRQAITLSLFCRKLSIPFDVYGFTSGSNHVSERARRAEKLLDTTVPNRVLLGTDTKIFQLVSSTHSSADFKTAVKMLAGQVVTNFRYTPCSNMVEHIGGTPLAETLIVAHDIVKDFRIKHKVENMNVVFLTDGDGGALSANTRIHMTTYMMLHGRQITFRSRIFEDVYGALVENLRITQGCKVIGYFVVPMNHGAITKSSIQTKIPFDTLKNTLKESGFIRCNAHNYDEYYLIRPVVESDDIDPFADVTDESSIKQIARSMLSAGKNTQKNKALLRSLAKSFAV